MRRLGRIEFNYLPQSPTDHGWDVGFDKGTPPEQQHSPEFAAAPGTPIAGSIRITHAGRYYMDCPIEQVQCLANVVEYCVKPMRDGTFYPRIEVSSRDKTQTKTVWLRHVLGSGVPSQIDPFEWSFDVQGKLLEDEWTLIKLQLHEEVEHSFGRDGFVYQSLKGLRIRGNLYLSPVTFYRIE